MLPVLVVPAPLPRRHFGAAAGGVHPIIKRVRALLRQSRWSTRAGLASSRTVRWHEDLRRTNQCGAAPAALHLGPRHQWGSTKAAAIAGGAARARLEPLAPRRRPPSGASRRAPPP